MTAERRGPAPAIRRADGRYLRFSHRYNTWQMLAARGQWVNVRADLARCYAAAGFPVATTDQTELFEGGTV